MSNCGRGSLPSNGCPKYSTDSLVAIPASFMACVQRPVPAKISRVLSPHANAGLSRKGSKSPKSGHSTSMGSSTVAVAPPAALPRCCRCAAKALQC
eukprot:7924352-Pyramimonas_sp.AAC.1